MKRKETSFAGNLSGEEEQAKIPLLAAAFYKCLAMGTWPVSEHQLIQYIKYDYCL
jgi:hypothetical protein